MRARTLVLLLLAILLAGGTALLARSWLASQKTEAELKAVPVPLPVASKSVLVARGDVKRGQILRPDDLVWQVWPEGGIDKNYVVLGGPKKPEAFAGWVAKNPIGGGEPITESRIIAPGNRGFLAAVLRPGMRAMSVPVTVTSGISGFIFPGDEVDLMLVHPVPLRSTAAEAGRSPFEHKAAETVLHNIRVIAIDQRLESKAGEAVPAHTATFEVTPKQSEIIALADDMGKVLLTLRSLVPTAEEAAAGSGSGGSTVADPTAAAATATYTLDSEVSPLLPRAPGDKNSKDTLPVTILRGGSGGKTS